MRIQNLPFYLIHNREKDLLNDLNYRRTTEPIHTFDPFNHMFEAVLSSGNTERTEITKLLEETQKKTQDKQKHDFDRRHLSSAKVEIVYKVILKDKRR